MENMATLDKNSTEHQDGLVKLFGEEVYENNPHTPIVDRKAPMVALTLATVSLLAIGASFVFSLLNGFTAPISIVLILLSTVSFITVGRFVSRNEVSTVINYLATFLTVLGAMFTLLYVFLNLSGTFWVTVFEAI